MVKVPQEVVNFCSGGDKVLNSRKKKQAPLAPLGMRLYCICGDYLIGHFLTYFLLSFPFFSLMEKNLVSSFSFGTESFSLGFFIYWHLITVLMRFSHTLLLGVTPFELLAGLKNEGPWWWQRLAGGARVLMGSLVDISVISNLPLFVKKPSFKESTIGCRLLKGDSSKRKYLMPVLCLIAGLVAIMGPLIKDFTIIDTLIVSVDEIKKETLVKGGDFKAFKTYRSEKFHFEAFSSLANNRYALFPDFEFTKVKSQKRVNPFLLIYDSKQRNSGELKIGHSLNLLELLKRGKLGNPLFKGKFPHLEEAMKGSLISSKPRSWEPGQTQKPLFSDEIKLEIQKLIQASFELGPKRIAGHILEYGPFLRGFIQLREIFLYLLRPGIKPEVDFIKMGSMDFLRFRQVFPKDLPFNKGVIETYIPIETPFSVTIVMGWDHSLPGALSANTFRQNFLGDAKWYFDYRAVFPFPSQEKDMNSLVLLDFLSKDLKHQAQNELREEYLYQYYYHQCRNLLKERDIVGQEIVKNNMIRITSLFEVKNANKTDSFSRLFMERWSELYSAFIGQESSYFNL